MIMADLKLMLKNFKLDIQALSAPIYFHKLIWEKRYKNYPVQSKVTEEDINSFVVDYKRLKSC
jgi:hypothetical protein